MKATDLYEMFLHLHPSTQEGEFQIQQIRDEMYLAKSSNNEFSVLLRYSASFTLPSGRVTKGLELKFYSRTSFLLNGQSTNANWAIVRCRETHYNDLFSVLAEGICHAIERGELQTPDQLVQYIAEWQQLLSFRKELSKMEYIGLWGELHILTQADDIQTAVERWKGPDRKKFDFSHNGVEVEVKTSTKGHVHIFSQEQLQTSITGAARYIASLYVEEDWSGGKTVTDLIRTIRGRLASQESFGRKVLATGYFGPMEIEAPLSLRACKLVAVSEVPKVTQYDLGVSDIHFDSDLTFCPEVQHAKHVLDTLFGNSNCVIV